MSEKKTNGVGAVAEPPAETAAPAPEAEALAGADVAPAPSPAAADEAAADDLPADAGEGARATHAKIWLRPDGPRVWIDPQTTLVITREPTIVPVERIGRDTRRHRAVCIEES